MTPQQAATLTTDELRDWCAEDDGWTLTPMGAQRQIVHPDPTATYTYTAVVPVGPYRWLRGGVVHKDHPHTPTIDGAAKAMPDGWDWWKVTAEWAAQAAHTPMIRIPDTGDEIADRYRLAVLCRIAEKEASK